MVNWDHQADAKLLVAILQTANPKLDLDALAKAFGDGVTANAIHHRLRKLKEKVNDATSLTDSPNSPAKSLAKASPKKRGRPAKPKDAAKDAEKDDEPAMKKTKADSKGVDGEVSAS